jgi:hypothetical protein
MTQKSNEIPPGHTYNPAPEVSSPPSTFPAQYQNVQMTTPFNYMQMEPQYSAPEHHQDVASGNNQLQFKRESN